MNFEEYDNIQGNVPNQFLGSNVSVYENIMVITSVSNIYIYENVNNTWELHSTLTRPSVNRENNIYVNGIHLIITDGTTIYPYVYSSVNDTWEAKNTITPNDNYVKNLGCSIKIYGDKMYISDNYWSPNTSSLYMGKVFIYTLTGARNWILSGTSEISLQNNGGSKNDKFGTCIDVNENFIIISAPTKSAGIKKYGGKVYVYNRSTYNLVQELTASPIDQNIEFGTSCIITPNNNILVGAPKYSNKYVRSGAVYFFTYSGSNSWSFTKRVRPNTEIKYGLFGQSIYMDENNTAIIGYPGYDNYGNNNTGAIYIYDDILTSDESYFQINNDGWMNLTGREMQVFKSNNVINIVIGIPNNSSLQNNGGLVSVIKNVILVYYNESQIMFGDQIVVQ